MMKYPSMPDLKQQMKKVFDYRRNIMVFEAIAELIAERNDCDPSTITPDMKFSDLGIDSLDTVEMLMNLEDKIGQEIELEEKVETVGDLVAYIEARLEK